MPNETGEQFSDTRAYDFRINPYAHRITGQTPLERLQAQLAAGVPDAWRARLSPSRAGRRAERDLLAPCHCSTASRSAGAIIVQIAA
jgi:hypothetical protein